MSRYMFGFMTLVVGLWSGNWIPDFDHNTGLLLHRSIVTHGSIVPLTVVIIAASSRRLPVRWFALGLAVGTKSEPITNNSPAKQAGKNIRMWLRRAAANPNAWYFCGSLPTCSYMVTTEVQTNKPGLSLIHI
mgnify:CR=1 FL=1